MAALSPRTHSERLSGFSARWTLINLFGFRVQIDLSWLFLAFLISWSLSSVAFPVQFPGLSPLIYWSMGICGMIGLVISLIFHELSHALVGRRYGIPIRGITLFIFGGVAELTEEPSTPQAELWMALAGPAASIVLAGGFLLLSLLALAVKWPEPVTGVIAYLSVINLVLAVFNLAPAFPLDGGRVLRAVLWWWKGDSLLATRWASAAGGLFGLMLMVLGVYEILIGGIIGGLWWLLIGMFVRSAAKSSLMQFAIHRMLAGAPVRRFMTENPIAAPADISVRRFVEDYIYTFHHSQFPVFDGERLLGMAGSAEVKAVPLAGWDDLRVRDIVVPAESQNTIEADADAAKALSRMTQNHAGRLLVLEKGRLKGILALKDLLDLLSVRLELEHRQ